MDLLVEPFTSDAEMARALVAGLVTVVATSTIGTWIVLRGMSFIGDAVAHGVIPGIALAVLWGVNPMIGAAVAAVVMVGGISGVSKRSRLPDDTSIGVLFVGMLALGVSIASYQGADGEELTEILFGDALGVTSADIIAISIVAVIVLLVSLVAYRPFLVLTFSWEKAEALGMRPAIANLAMLVLVGLTIVVSFSTVGTLMVFAFLVAPPAAASLVVRRVPLMMGLAIALGVVAVFVGLLASHHLGTAPSPAIALVAVGEFFAVLVGRDITGVLRSRRATAIA